MNTKKLSLPPNLIIEFDTLASEFLKRIHKVVPLPSKGGFRPDSHAVASLTAEQIVGPIKFILNPDEVREQKWIFSHGNELRGLPPKEVTQLIQLAKDIQAQEGIRDLIGTRAILDTICDWITERYNHAHNDAFCHYILKHIAKSIDTFTFYFPISNTYIESELKIGSMIEVRPLSRAQLDEWKANFINRAPSQRDRLEEIFVSRFQRHQGCAALVITTEGEPDFAQNLALKHARMGAAMLRIFDPALVIPHIRSYCALHDEHPRPIITTFTEDSSGQFLPSGELARNDCQPLHISKAEINRLQPVFWDHINDILSPPTTDFREALLSALEIYFRAAIADDISEKLIFVFAALETMLLKNSNESVGMNVRERLAIAISTSSENRENMKDTIKRAYRLRSNFFHHGRPIDDQDIVGMFLQYAFRFFIMAVSVPASVKTKAEFIAALDSHRITSQ